MTAEGLSVGLIVTHRTWGLGKGGPSGPTDVWVSCCGGRTDARPRRDQVAETTPQRASSLGRSLR